MGFAVDRQRILAASREGPCKCCENEQVHDRADSEEDREQADEVRAVCSLAAKTRLNARASAEDEGKHDDKAPRGVIAGLIPKIRPALAESGSAAACCSARRRAC